MPHDRPGRAQRVAAAIATFNRKDTLRQCLSALLGQTRRLDQVIVVDNASADGTAAMVAEQFPSVRLVAMTENTGAAGAFAAGLAAGVAGGNDWVWLFNDDDIPEPDALATMLEAAAALPLRTGIVGCARRDELGNPYGLGLRWRHRHVHVPPADPDDPPLAVDVVAFSGTLVHAETVRQIGVPKPQFFMMGEELDYCLRVRDAGWNVYVLPRQLVTAFAMGSEGLAPPWRGYYQTRNQLAMTLERRSVPEFAWWLERTLRFCLGALRGGDRPAERVRLRLLGAWHAVRGVSGRTVLPAAPPPATPARSRSA
jgi:rhamnopyranosyl-N-acetylglucosaminyl-diphospho-decaprenol beta-1,3/1,4-galactofuranosyltransferase